MTSTETILDYFAKQDPKLHKIALGLELDEFLLSDETKNYFERLCRAIAGQQLSTKAAATIWQRFYELVGEGSFTPEKIVLLTHEEMRSVGLSNAKAKYINGFAQAIVDKNLDIDNLNNLTNEAVIEELTKLKGVGLWTAEMFLMFTLGREDLFSSGDLGLKRAIEKIKAAGGNAL